MRIADGARLLSCFLICLSISPSLLESQTVNLSSIGPTAGSSAEPKRSETDIPRSVLGNLPLQFEENKGQAEGSIRFLARGLGYTLLLNPDGLELNLRQKGNRPTRHLSMHLLGTQASNLLGRDLTATQTNYYLGRDPRNWHLGVRSYSSVVYEGVYKGIDLIYHGSGSQLEYDFVIAPGSDPTQIRMRFDGLKPLLQGKDLSFEAEDKLSVRTLKAFQILDGIKKTVDAEWEIAGDQASIHLGPYDHGRELIIDPIFFYGTYIGGSSNDGAVSIVPASQPGYFYVALSTDSATIDQPTPPTTNTKCGGQSPCPTDTLILGLNATNAPQPPSGLIPYGTADAPLPTAIVDSATYIGGTTGSTTPTAMAIDSNSNLYISGETNVGANFTQLDTIKPCSQSCIGFVTKFATSLNTSTNPISAALTLQYSYGLPASPLAIAVNGSGDTYLTGSGNNTPGGEMLTMPPGNTPCQSLVASTIGQHPGLHAFLLELNPNGSTLFCSYIGGSGVDQGNAITVSGTTVYVAGQTSSQDFPITAGAFKGTKPTSGQDAFVLGASNLATSPNLVFSTHLGGTGKDAASSIAVSPSGNIVVAGSTDSSGFPIQDSPKFSAAKWPIVNVPVDPSDPKSPTFSQLPTTPPTLVALPTVVPPGSQDAFVMSLTGDGTTLLFTDFLGGIAANQSQTSAQALAVDGVGVIYVTGSTTATFTSGNNSNQGDFMSGNATEDIRDLPGVSNVFFGEIDPTGAFLLEATLAGSPGTDMANSLTISRPLDPAGVVSIVGASTISPPSLFESASKSAVDPVAPPPPSKSGANDTTGFFVQEALAGYCKMAPVRQAGTSLTFSGPCVSGTQGGSLFVTPSNLLPIPIVVSASGTTLSGTVTVDVSSLQGQTLNFSFGFLPLGAIGGTGQCSNNVSTITNCGIFTSGGGAGTIFSVTPGKLSVTLSCVGPNCTYSNKPNTVLIGQPITLNAAVANGLPNTVIWSSSAGTFSSPNPSASMTFTPGGTGGPIVVTATPVADPSFPAQTITLNTIEPTNVSFPDQGPFVSGQTNIPVDVSAGTGSARVPNGDVVTYQVDGGPSGSSTLINGAASIQLASLAVGTHNLVVNYPGNSANFLASSSNMLPFTVNPAQPNVVTLSASSIFFGSIVQGTPSGPQSITLTNSGANTLSGLTLKLGGTNAGEFALTPGTTCGVSLAANSTCSVAVTFTPASLGTRSAVLVISYTGTGSPQAVNLGGTGVAPLSVTSSFTQFVAGTTSQFTASAPATWTATAGTITSSGFFTAPNPVATPIQITVTATSASNAQATTQITVFPAPAIIVPSTNTLPAGGSVSIAMSISAGTGIAGEAMTFACSPATLPTGVSCFFTPNPVVNAGGAKVTLQLFSNSARNNLPTRDYPWRRSPLDGYTVIAVGCILMCGRKKYSGRLMIVLAVSVGSTALLSLSACGTSGSFNGTTQPGHVTGTYTINISVSGASPGSADYNQTLTTVPLKVVLQ
jgi:hypothetical protein